MGPSSKLAPIMGESQNTQMTIESISLQTSETLHIQQSFVVEYIL